MAAICTGAVVTLVVLVLLVVLGLLLLVSGRDS